MLRVQAATSATVYASGCQASVQERQCSLVAAICSAVVIASFYSLQHRRGSLGWAEG